MSSCVNLFALHYFLWFSSTASIYGYVSVYAEHYANSSSSQYGMLNMILPFITIGTKLVFCSLADRHNAYRMFFVIFLTTALLGYGSFAVLPFLIKPQPKTDGLNYLTFSLICLMTGVGTISMSVISCLSDAFAVNSAKKYNTSYGMIRLWGTVGWGISAVILAFINQTDKLPLLVPGLIMTIVLLLIDIIATLAWKNKEDFKLDKSASNVSIEDIVSVLANPKSRENNSTVIRQDEHIFQRTSGDSGKCCYGTKELGVNTTGACNSHYSQTVDISSVRMQWILFKQVACRRKSIFRYMSLFTISGALIALQWSYFFLYLNKIYANDFSYISGLSMFGQSMLGELPFFLLSHRIVQALGRSHTLSVSIASIGIRYLLYEYLLPNANMYFVLLTETLQGPNFGLFYVVMTEVGLDYSDCEEAIVSTVERGIISNDPTEIEKLRQALRATMQSLMSACYEGLGVGIGSIVGGLAIDNYGFSNLWFYAAVTALLLGLANFIIDSFGFTIFRDRQSTVVLR